MIKEITDGMGNIKNPERSLEMFKRTTRDYEFNKALPNNGPSPHPNQFSPKLGFVLPKAPQMPAYNQTVTSPRRNRNDKHEGEHNLYGKSPNCSKC